MKSKKAVAITSLLMILLASFALVMPSSSQGDSYTHHYIVMGGIVDSCTQMGPFDPTFWMTPFQTRPPDLTPLLMEFNVTFSDPWELSGYGWIVNLTIPAEAFVGIYHVWYDSSSDFWFNLQHYMSSGSDGHGWIFLNATGDVDCYTFSNDTGTYWGPESSKAGELAALTGDLPSVGSDGVPGTADDGFGNGTTDPRGSSIVLLPSKVRCEFWDGAAWDELFDIDWPVIFTTGTSYNIVDEPASDLDNVNATRTGQPQEFYAGIDHPEYDPVPWGDPYCDAYITYASCWSLLNIDTALGDLDVALEILYKTMREDCVLPDIKGDDEEVKIFDIRRAAKAYDQYDESAGDDGIPETGDDRPVADALFDGAADAKDPRGYINIFDIRRIAKDYGKKLTPDGIITT